MRRSPGSFVRQTTAIFDIAAPFADGSVQVLVISVVAQPIVSVAIVKPAIASSFVVFVTMVLSSLSL
jgi:hypothetical protein